MMDYKKIFKTEESRFKVLRIFDFVPDRLMIRAQYRIKCGRKLNLKNPKRYTEKIQWYKLYFREEQMVRCADKYTVRSFVEERGLSEYLNPLLAVWNAPDEIDFNSLPDSFALKVTNGSGTNIFVSNKRNADIVAIKKQIKIWMSRSKISPGREWAYYKSTPRIVAEELLPRDKNNDLPDYKFFCFNGVPKFLYTMIDYTDHHENGKLGFFDMDYNLLPFGRTDFARITEAMEKPDNFDEMKKIAQKLSEGFPHVRVDLYNLDGKIVFGEMTFYNASGYTIFAPDSADFEIGEMFVLPARKESGGGNLTLILIVGESSMQLQLKEAA